MALGLGEFFSLACALAWSVAVILFKRSGESLAPLPLNLFKNTLAAALFVLTILLVQGAQWPDIPGGVLPWILFSGFLGIGIGDSLYFKSLNAIGAARMAVAQTLYTPFVILLSMLFLGERLSPVQIAGVGCVLAGILFVTYTPALEPADRKRLGEGVFYAGLSVLAMAAGIVTAKPLLERYDFLWVVLLRIVGGLLGLVVFMAWRIRPSALMAAYRGVHHWPTVIAGAVVGMYVSTMLWLAGYKYTQASIAAVLNEMAALFILALSVLFLRERVTPRQFAGTLLAMVGVALVVLR